jgi:hypothetical protein
MHARGLGSGLGQDTLCSFPFTAAHPAMRAAAMEPGEIAMQGVIHSLHSLFDSLWNSPYHPVMYIAAAALLLVGIPLIRAVLRSSRRRVDTASLNTAVPSTSPSMLGLTSPPMESRTGILEFAPPAVSKVTAINESLSMPCIHCGVTISSRQDFCPSCGYAQPVKHGLKAAFPA